MHKTERLFDPEKFIQELDNIEEFDAAGNVALIRDIPVRYSPTYINTSMVQAMSRWKLSVDLSDAFLKFFEHVNEHPTSPESIAFANTVKHITSVALQPSPPGVVPEVPEEVVPSSKTSSRCFCSSSDDESSHRTISEPTVLLSDSFEDGTFFATEKLRKIRIKNPKPDDCYEAKIMVKIPTEAINNVTITAKTCNYLNSSVFSETVILRSTLSNETETHDVHIPCSQIISTRGSKNFYQSFEISVTPNEPSEEKVKFDMILNVMRIPKPSS
jgi:hypothetical protein